MEIKLQDLEPSEAGELTNKQNDSNENNEFYDINYNESNTFDVKYEDHSSTSSDSTSNFKKALKSCIANISVEPICILFCIAKQIFTMVDQNLFMEKICLVNLGYNDSVCEGLIKRNISAYNPEQENAVQKLASVMTSYKIGITSFVPFLLLMTLGAWSDKFSRRKPCILLPLVGEIIGNIGMIITIYFFKLLSAEWSVVLSCIPSAFGGNFYLFYMGLYNYVASIVEKKSTTIRIGALTVSLKVGVGFGLAISGIAYKTIGFYGAYSLSLVLFIIALSIALKIKEVPGAKKYQLTYLQHFKEIVHYKNFSETFAIVCKKRPNNNRKRILVLFLAQCFITALHMAEYTMTYMYTRKRFQWNEVDFGFFLIAGFLSQLMGGSIALVLFAKVFKWDDGLFGFASTISKMCGSIIHGLATSGPIFCIGNLAEMLNLQSSVAVRSAIVKCVEPNEIAKITAVMSMVEALALIFFTFCYSRVYALTVDTYPNTFMFFSTIICIPNLILFYWLHLQLKNDTTKKDQKK